MTETAAHDTALLHETTTGVRCSDAEREKTCSALHVAAGEGRLSLDEVDERIEKVFAARYRHELDDVIADLPVAPEAATGWPAIVTAVRRQLASEAAALLGRGGVSARRRLVLALVTFATAFFVVSALLLAFHGVGGDGFEHHQFGH